MHGLFIGPFSSPLTEAPESQGAKYSESLKTRSTGSVRGEKSLYKQCVYQRSWSFIKQGLKFEVLDLLVVV